jgi:hypothetical protein
MKGLGFCKVVFPDRLERDSVVTAIFGGGLVVLGTITYKNKTGNWKLFFATFCTFLGGYAAYFWLFSILKEYKAMLFHFL